MASNTIQVFEHGQIHVDHTVFTERHFNALVRFNEKNSDRIFTVRHKSLLFGGHVGVIKVGNLSIEILPKTDEANDISASYWQNVLIDMLKFCGDLKTQVSGWACLHLKRANLLDLYLMEFVSEVGKILTSGLVKRYNRRAGNHNTLKGRLLFSDHIKHNYSHKERFFSEHDIYNCDNLINQILKQALKICSSISASLTVQNRAFKLIDAFDQVSDKIITRKAFDRLRFDRKTDKYKRAIALAHLIILNYQPDVKSGQNNVLAILFAMNDLFERYVVNCVRQSAIHNYRGISVFSQQHYPIWKLATGDSGKRIRPDIEIWVSGQRKAIIDTKWKQPGRYPSDDDLKQMYVYGNSLGTARNILVYPRTDNRQNVNGLFVENAMKKNCDSANISDRMNLECNMCFINIFDNEYKLSKDLGREVIYYALNDSSPDQVLHGKSRS